MGGIAAVNINDRSRYQASGGGGGGNAGGAAVTLYPGYRSGNQTWSGAQWVKDTPQESGGGGGGGGGMTNTADPNPDVKRVQGQLDDYIKGIPGAAGDTMETAGMKTRDAFEGVYKGLDERAARGGVAGTGAHELRRYSAGGDLARALSGQNRDIALGARQQAGQMLLGAGNLALGGGALQQGQQRIGLDQYGLGLQEQNQGYQQRLALAGLYPQFQQSGSGY